MSVQVTIIGLGQIGASIGLALADHADKIRRVGSDIEPEIAARACRMGAVDRVEHNLNAAVRDADIVLLAIPLDQMEEMIAAIGPELKPGAVLMEVSPAKVVAARWATEHLGEGCSYVGITPVLNPQYLNGRGGGLDAAREDLFHGGLFGIVQLPGTPNGALQAAVSLANMVGASPFFADLYEMDGLMTAVRLLPQLVSAALVRTVMDQPGWREARKVSGRVFAQATSPAADLESAPALAQAVMANRENLLYALDQLVATLRSLQDDIAQERTRAVGEFLAQACEDVIRWRAERGSGEWQAEAFPNLEETRPVGILESLLGVGGRTRKK